jgi:hypothetical protein
MEENQKKLEATLEMFKPFLEGNNLSTEMSHYLETVYNVSLESMTFNKRSNLFEGKKIFPEFSNVTNYYVAEFWFPYSNCSIRTTSNSFMISHIFKLDFNHIELKINTISNGTNQLTVERLALGIQMYYHLLHEYLLMKNGKEDLDKIAEVLNIHFKQIVAKKFIL